MNIIQYLTVGIHTCFRIKKPPQQKSSVIYPDLACTACPELVEGSFVEVSKEFAA